MPDLDPNCLTLTVFLKEFFEKVDFEKNQQTTKEHEKLPSRQRVKAWYLANTFGIWKIQMGQYSYTNITYCSQKDWAVV